MHDAGTISDFASRLHSTPTGLSDLSAYITEGNAYIQSGIVNIGLSGKWEREAEREKYEFDKNPADFFTELFSSGLPLAYAMSINLINQDDNPQYINVFPDNGVIGSSWQQNNTSSPMAELYVAADAGLTRDIQDLGSYAVDSNETFYSINNFSNTYLNPQFFYVTSGDGVNFSSKPVTGAPYALTIEGLPYAPTISIQGFQKVLNSYDVLVTLSIASYQTSDWYLYDSQRRVQLMVAYSDDLSDAQVAADGTADDVHGSEVYLTGLPAYFYVNSIGDGSTFDSTPIQGPVSQWNG